jgi:hypothetical protein
MPNRRPNAPRRSWSACSTWASGAGRHGRDRHRQGDPRADLARRAADADLAEAKGIATRANDYLAERCAAHPDRFIGLTAVAPQDPAWSAAEIRRGAGELGFKGVQINSHTQGAIWTIPSSTRSSARSPIPASRSTSIPPRRPMR